MTMLICLLVYVVVWLSGIATQYALTDLQRRQKENNR